MAIRPAVMLTIAAVTVVALTLWQVSNVVRIKTLLIAIEQKQHSLDSLHALVRHEQIAIARLSPQSESDDLPMSGSGLFSR